MSITNGIMEFLSNFVSQEYVAGVVAANFLEYTPALAAFVIALFDLKHGLTNVFIDLLQRNNEI